MERKNVWNIYDAKQQKACMDFAEQYKAFLDQCKTERECVDFFVNEAEKAGYNANVSGTKRASERVGAKTGASSVKKEQKSYGEKVDPILKESETALKEMGRLYSTIKDPEIRSKINEIMLVTDKIAKDAIEDPSDVPQIKKFFRYYLPTTIKLLHAYDRMSSQEIKGENIDKSIDNINEMLDVAIDAYKKRLESLFENQALDIETDID